MTRATLAVVFLAGLPSLAAAEDRMVRIGVDVLGAGTGCTNLCLTRSPVPAGDVVQVYKCSDTSRQVLARQKWIFPSGEGPIRVGLEPQLCLDASEGLADLQKRGPWSCSTWNATSASCLEMSESAMRRLVRVSMCDGGPGQQFVLPDKLGMGPVELAGDRALKLDLNILGFLTLIDTRHERHMLGGWTQEQDYALSFFADFRQSDRLIANYYIEWIILNCFFWIGCVVLACSIVLLVCQLGRRWSRGCRGLPSFALVEAVVRWLRHLRPFRTDEKEVVEFA
eukprot:CAMPEP_0203921780 /NCGR_PEP_ID=MMETSP0359-20131031/61891_1 /ASSEMBLY_ACC=CAM_ASM_000338 /TAXON_ID=268821 /ORGANISM="Scrippsiella Hangoei, Strain SHTV-5" /LENGTH=281 /DNA_ID=CAMNT_0050849533 /DNA_START=28 /DNA_END=870 /DNA_ORIENTATION=+